MKCRNGFIRILAESHGRMEFRHLRLVEPLTTSTTVRYIQSQTEHHKRISFTDELEKFLAAHGIIE